MISSKAFFAIELCVFLAHHKAGAFVTTSTLSRRLGLSVSHVEHILKSLREHQLVYSVKGPGGGYALLAKAAEVSIWDIACVFERTLAQAKASGDKTYKRIADYEWGLEEVVIAALQQQFLADFVDASVDTQASQDNAVGRFKLKPLAPAFMPKAPNSVFQWHTAC